MNLEVMSWDLITGFKRRSPDWLIKEDPICMIKREKGNVEFKHEINEIMHLKRKHKIPLQPYLHLLLVAT